MTDDFNPVEWITTKEAAELTGYADAYIRQLIGRGRLKAKKRGRDWFLSKADPVCGSAAFCVIGPVLL